MAWSTVQSSCHAKHLTVFANLFFFFFCVWNCTDRGIWLYQLTSVKALKTNESNQTESATEQTILYLFGDSSGSFVGNDNTAARLCSSFRHLCTAATLQCLSTQHILSSSIVLHRNTANNTLHNVILITAATRQKHCQQQPLQGPAPLTNNSRSLLQQRVTYWLHGLLTELAYWDDGDNTRGFNGVICTIFILS